MTAVPDVKIETLSLGEVLEHDRVKYNVNNLWADQRPHDYFERLDAIHARHWMPLLKPEAQRLSIWPGELPWLKECARLCSQTGRWSGLFEDDMALLLARHADVDAVLQQRRWFVRSDTVSFKYGQHGAGPYSSLRQVIESAVSSLQGHTPLFNEATELNLWLVPWIDNIGTNNEFRLFVHQGRLTAISQQQLYARNTRLTPTLAREWAQVIHAYFEAHIKPLLDSALPALRQGCTIDLAVLDGNTPYFIEFNSFGAESAAGSALFHWLDDAEKLESHEQQQQPIWFRYVDRN